MELEEDTELDPAAEFPILYGLLTAPKSEEVKPKKFDTRRILRIEADSSLSSRENPPKPVATKLEEDESLPTSTTTLSEDEELEKSMKRTRRRFQAFKNKYQARDDPSESNEEEEESFRELPCSSSPTLVSRVQNNGELLIQRRPINDHASQIEKLREILCVVKRQRAGLRRKVQEMNSQRSMMVGESEGASASSNHDLIVSHGKLSNLNLTYAILKKSHMLKKRRHLHHHSQPGMSNSITGTGALGSPSVNVVGQGESLESDLKLNCNLKRHLGRREVSNKFLHSYLSLIRKRKESLAQMALIRNDPEDGSELENLSRDHLDAFSLNSISMTQTIRNAEEDEDSKDSQNSEFNENAQDESDHEERHNFDEMETREAEDHLNNLVGSSILSRLHTKHEPSEENSAFFHGKSGNHFEMEVLNNSEESKDLRNNWN